MEKLKKFNTLKDRLREIRPRPDNQGAAFAAASLMASQADADFLIRTVQKTHQELEERLGHFHAPTGTLRWLYATLLASQGKPSERFLQAKTVLKQAQKDKTVGRLYAGGSRAALILTLTAEPSPDTIQSFIAMKTALTPPWWRSDTSVTDMFAAGHVGAGHTPQDVLARREQALEIFSQDKLTRHHKREASRLCVLLEQNAGSMLERMRMIEAWRQEEGFVKHRSDRSLVVQWAAEGLSLEDLTAIEEIARELKSHSGAGHQRFRLAHLIQSEGGSSLPGASLSALSAVMAAQAAIAASTVVVTSAAVSSS